MEEDDDDEDDDDDRADEDPRDEKEGREVELECPKLLPLLLMFMLAPYPTPPKMVLRFSFTCCCTRLICRFSAISLSVFCLAMLSLGVQYHSCDIWLHSAMLT